MGIKTFLASLMMLITIAAMCSAAVPCLARIHDGRLCISAYRLDSRRTYPVQTIQTNIQLV